MLHPVAVAFDAIHRGGLATARDSNHVDSEHDVKLVVSRFKGAMTDTTKLKNSVALVLKRTIPSERLSLVSEVSANFCG
jgi:hypothetical protein